MLQTATRGARPGVSSACCRALPPEGEEEDERGARADASGRARRPDDDARASASASAGEVEMTEATTNRERRADDAANRSERDEADVTNETEADADASSLPPRTPRAIELEVGFEEPDLPAFEPLPRVPGSPSASGRINREDSRRIRTLDAMKRDARAALRRSESDERRAEES